MTTAHLDPRIPGSSSAARYGPHEGHQTNPRHGRAAAFPTIRTLDKRVRLASIHGQRARGEGLRQKRRPVKLMGTHLVWGCARPCSCGVTLPEAGRGPWTERAFLGAAGCSPRAEGLSSQQPGLTAHRGTKLTLP